MKYCFYHKSDLDGQSSAAIAKKFIPDIELIPYNCYDEFPWDTFNKDDYVYFVDVVLQPHDLLIKLYNLIGDKLYIFDHHKSFLESEEYTDLKNKIPLNLNCNTRFAGCELTWLYLSKGKPIPPVIKLLGQYDSWRDTSDKKYNDDYDWDEVVLPFQFGMQINRFNPLKEEDLSNFYKLLDRDVSIIEIVNRGKMLLQYQENQNNIVMKSSFDATIKGYNCLCVNGGLRNSLVFKSKWDKEKYHFMVAFSMTRDMKWSWSFYTDRDDVDASILAKEFSGGGHRKAAGAITKDLIFEVA